MQATFRGLGAVLRGVGAAVDSLGAALQGSLAPTDRLLPPLNRLALRGVAPAVPTSAWVAPNAAVMGDVTIGERSSVWYGVTIRGDVNSVTIGHTTNIQDRAVLHVAKHNPQNAAAPTVIGNKVTIGHGAVIHAATIGDEVIVGMGAIVLDGAVVEPRSIVGGGALVTPGTRVPSGQLWLGAPAKYHRDLEPAELQFIGVSADKYAALADEHADECSKVWLTALHDARIHDDLQNRDPNLDQTLGIDRDPATRLIARTPYDRSVQ